ncbi:MAG TPA: polyhydroxyalkanoic acid system family protein [Pseudomonadales bacterium]|jgi:putative polyhydroxyalkanoate system protein|nr:polyhydroxyalkanoic acid system family protein [Pseudomonadales bacterium]
MAVIRVTRNHRLPRVDLRAQIESLADEIQEKLHARCRWDGDTAHFSRSGASGFIKLDDERIAIEITLGLALTPLKSRVERTVNERLDEILA